MVYESQQRMLQINELNNNIDDLGVNIKKYGALGDESINCAEAFEKASIEHSSIYVPAGRYVVNGANLAQKNLRITFDPDAVIVTSENQSAFIYKGRITEKINILNITTDKSPKYPTTPVSVLTVTSTVEYSVGDVVRIISESLIYTTGAAVKRAEFGIVSYIEGNKLYLNTTLRHIHDNQPKVYKLKGDKLELVNAQFDTTNVIDNKAPFVSVEHSVFPTFLSTMSIKGGGELLKLASCFMYKVDKMQASNLTNDPANGNIGYGVNDQGSYAGLVSNCTFTNVRHGYTTTAGEYGDTAFARINNCEGHGCTNAPFDTHREAYNIEFNDCRSFGTLQGADSLGAGFQLRSTDSVLRGCTSESDLFGFYLFQEADNALIENFVARNTKFRSGMIQGRAGRKLNVTLRNSFLSSLETGNEVFKVSYANLRMLNVRFTLGASIVDYCRIINVDNGVIEGRMIEMNCSQYKGNSFRFVHLADAEAYFYDLTLIKGNVSYTNTFTGDTSTAITKLRAYRVDGDLEAADTFGIKDVLVDYPIVTSNIQTQTIGRDGLTLLYATSLTASPTIYAPVDPILPGLSIGNFRKGAFVGQRLVVRNVSYDNDVGIVSGEFVSVPNNFRIGQRSKEEFVWNGGVWV